MLWRIIATVICMAVSSPTPQLPLPFKLEEEATFDNFLVLDASRELCTALGAEREEPLHFVHGAHDVGKTHLLQAACHFPAGEAMYLPLTEIAALDPTSLLQDLENSARIAIDDLQVVAGDPQWEEALFHLINRCRDSGCQLIVAARRPPTDLGLVLPDLRSRMAGGITWALSDYSDSDKRDILVLRAARRGLHLAPAVLDYLGVRASRSLADLLDLLQRLDKASLQAKRPLTVPLIREVTGW